MVSDVNVNDGGLVLNPITYTGPDSPAIELFIQHLNDRIAQGELTEDVVGDALGGLFTMLGYAFDLAFETQREISTLKGEDPGDQREKARKLLDEIRKGMTDSD